MADDRGDLSEALASARKAAGQLLREPADVEDAVQMAAMQLHMARDAGVVLRSVVGFMAEAARRVALRMLREQRNRQKHVVLDAENLIAGATVDGASALCWERLVERLRGCLGATLAGWLDDVLSGASDEQLAERDGVEIAAIRMRKVRLKASIFASPVVREFLDFPVTFASLRHPGDGKRPSDPPNTRTPEHPNSRTWRRKWTRAWRPTVGILADAECRS